MNYSQPHPLHSQSQFRPKRFVWEVPASTVLVAGVMICVILAFLSQGLSTDPALADWHGNVAPSTSTQQ